MSEQTETAETAPEAPAEKAASERRSFPIRVFAKTAEGAWLLAAGVEPFDEIAAAERWVKASGSDGVTYLLARTIGVREVEPRRVKEVAL